MFNWRIQFILDDLMRLLERDYSPLGVPGVLDEAVETVAPRIHRHSRLLLYTDLLGSTGSSADTRPLTRSSEASSPNAIPSRASWRAWSA